MAQVKKRKIPKEKRSRKKYVAHPLDMGLSGINYIVDKQEALRLKEEKIQLKKDAEFLAKKVPLSMEFCYNDARESILSFFDEYGFSFGDKSVFIPESVVIKAYNYCDLIIALKMQQATCTDWHVEATIYGYDLQKDQLIEVQYEKDLSGMTHNELYCDLPLKIDRGAGIKTRWMGLESEIERAFKEKAGKGIEISRIDLNLTGYCQFVSMSFYNEFIFLQIAREHDQIEGVFERLQQDLIKRGLMNEKLQPLHDNTTSIPVNMVNFFIDQDGFDVEKEIIKRLLERREESIKTITAEQQEAQV